MAAEVLEQCWSLWSRAEEHLRVREREEQSLYKFRSKTHVVQDTECEENERQLRNLFPSYEESMEEEMGGRGEEMVGDEEEKEDGAENGVVGRKEEVASFCVEDLQHIANLHLLLYGENVEKSVCPHDSRKMAYRLGSGLTNSLGTIPGECDIVLHVSTQDIINALLSACL